MTAPRILLVYGSSYGQTEKIAQRMRGVLESRGCVVAMVNARHGVPRLSADDYDGVIAGASMIARGHQPSVREFIAANLETLNAMPSAFFSVSASAGSVHEHSRAAAVRVRDAFLSQAGWTPDLTASIAGAIKYTRYNWLLRWYMKRASALNGGSTDTSRDHEYTDWSQVERFANEVADVVTRDAQVSAHT